MPSVHDLLTTLGQFRAIDLAQPYYTGIPHHPAHPPFLYGLNKKHGDYVNPGGASSASEAIALGAHVGTHIDALCHFTCNGRLFGGEEAAPVQNLSLTGIERHTVDTFSRSSAAACLFDIPKLAGVDTLPYDFVVDARAPRSGRPTLNPGDVALIRTGWAPYWDDPALLHLSGAQPRPGA